MTIKRNKLGRFMKGNQMPERVKIKIRNTMKRKGIKPCEEAIKNSERMLGKIPWNKGKKLSDEYRGKLAKAKENYKPNFGGKHYNGHKLVDKNMREKIRKTLMGHEVKQITINKIKIARVKQILPIKDTKIEVKVQNFLKQLGIEFFTHQYMKIEHGYQCDILIPSMNMVIECDGDYWHKYPVGLEKDHIRTSELIKNGFKVLRLWECEIKTMELDDFKFKLGGIQNDY